MIRPSFAIKILPSNRRAQCYPKRGAGNAGRPMRPIAACAMIVIERTRVSQVTPESPGTPRTMVYGLYAISPVTGLSCHRRPQETCKKLASQELDASVGASGPRDFAVRRQPSPVKRAARVHCIPLRVS